MVYNLSYKVYVPASFFRAHVMLLKLRVRSDDASAALFAEAGVILRRHAPA